MSKPEAKKILYCSFCGKSQHEVKKLIAGPTCFICDECVELCTQIIVEETVVKGSSYSKALEFYKRKPNSIEKFNDFFKPKSKAEQTEKTAQEILSKCDEIIDSLESSLGKMGG